MEARKLGFDVVIKRSGNGSDRRQAFITMKCEKSGMCHPPIRKLKYDDIRSRKYECPFKLCGYLKENNTWKFNVVYCIHNHALSDKLVDYPIVCRLIPEEKELVFDMTLNMVVPRNILATLKQKKPQNVSNIKQVYNMRSRNNKAVRCQISEMHQLLKLLEDDRYMSW